MNIGPVMDKENIRPEVERQAVQLLFEDLQEFSGQSTCCEYLSNFINNLQYTNFSACACSECEKAQEETLDLIGQIKKYVTQEGPLYLENINDIPVVIMCKLNDFFAKATILERHQFSE